MVNDSIPLWIKNMMRQNPAKARYYLQKIVATPKWADCAKMALIEGEVRRRRQRGEPVVCDHVVPLISDYACGLHCEDNLQVITEAENLKKSNKVWPDCWWEQQEMNLGGQLQLPFK
jgi:hypothetical protein